MIPTSVFPTLQRLYPQHKIIAIPEAWKVSSGWSVNLHAELPVLSQIRVLKEEAFTEVSLVLSNNNSKEELFIEWKLDDFNFCRPAKRIRHFAKAFIL